MQTNLRQTDVTVSPIQSEVFKENQFRVNGVPPGSALPDELVPSRYALRVGEIDVLVVSDGVLPIPAPVLATNADPAVRRAWLDDMFLPRPPDGRGGVGGQNRGWYLR